MPIDNSKSSPEQPDVTRYMADPRAADTYEILREYDDRELTLHVRDSHNLARESAGAALRYALDCGDGLLEGKRRRSGRQWDEWVEGDCHLNLRTGKLYVQLAQHRAEIEAAIGATPELSLRRARELISVRRGAKGQQQPKAKPAGSRTGVQALEKREAQARTAQDVGENSAGEAERLQARIDELQCQKRQLELKITRLESELAVLKAAPQQSARPEQLLEALEVGKVIDALPDNLEDAWLAELEDMIDFPPVSEEDEEVFRHAFWRATRVAIEGLVTHGLAAEPFIVSIETITGIDRSQLEACAEPQCLLGATGVLSGLGDFTCRTNSKQENA